jgi:hypothetical protein
MKLYYLFYKMNLKIHLSASIQSIALINAGEGHSQ